MTDEGLKEDGKSMSQIPTYVTSVPNGKEKVYRFQLLVLILKSANEKRDFSLQLI